MQYSDLVALINKHNHLYYDKSAPEISDADYDLLYDKLVEVEEKQGWKLPDSPTVKIGGQGGKVKHPFQLYSLKKVYDRSEVDPEFDIETPKIDGTNLTVIYKNHKLHLALTRGDGEYGDDVTHLVKYIGNIPEFVLYNTPLVAVTGECVTDNKDVTNFRNYVSGALGLKDADEFKSRNIQFIAHDIFGFNFMYSVKMDMLQRLGFKTVLTDKEYCSNYPQDGVVYRVNSSKRASEMGYTSKYPRFAVALKPRNELIAISTLQKVEWNVGRTGTVNPVGIIDPVDIDGATIERVTLHNIDIIEQHNLGLGDTIQIERAGGVIPKFNKVIQHSLHSHKISKLDAEKSIGGATKRIGPRLYVVDKEKHGTVKLLSHFISTIGIKGLGPQSIKKMDLNHPCDLYRKQNWDLLGVNGKKIEEEIKRSETKPYHIVLASLGIEGVGKSAAQKIIKVIPQFDRLKEIETYDIPTIGPKTKEKIVSWLIENEEWVKSLPLQLEADINILTQDMEARKVCISGKLDRTKQEMSNLLSDFNIEVVNNLTKDCYALISDGKESTKFKKAKQYGIKIINYWDEKINILNGQL